MGIPEDLDAVDGPWLTAALQAGGALDTSARVTGVRIGEPAGGIAVTSRVARLHLELQPPGTGPESVVIKLPNPAWTRGPALYEREVRFFRELASGSFVPQCLCADYDQGRFVLLLEDLTDAVPGHRLDGLNEPEALAVLEALADHHSTWWGSPRLADWPAKTYEAERAAELRAKFQTTWPQLVGMGRYPISEAVTRAAEQVEVGFVEGLVRLSSEPKTLIHSDVHAENLLLDGERVVLIDWQNACRGHPAFDVAGALSCVHPEVLLTRAEDLIRGYHERLQRTALETLRADVIAAVRWLFAGVAGWLVTFEVESLRDASTVQGHWERLSALLVAAHDP